MAGLADGQWLKSLSLLTLTEYLPLYLGFNYFTLFHFPNHYITLHYIFNLTSMTFAPCRFFRQLPMINERDENYFALIPYAQSQGKV